MTLPYKNLTFQVMMGIALGIVVGIFLPTWGPNLKLVSDIFIRLVKLVVGPIIFCTIVNGISSHSDIKQAGRIGLLAIIYFEIITTFALLIGLFSTHIFKPGVGIDTSHVAASDAAKYVEAATPLSAYDHILNIFPTSFVDAFAQNNLLQILFFSIAFGIVMALLGEKVASLKSMIGQFEQIVFKLLYYIVRVAPVAAFGAMAYTISHFGTHVLANLGELILSIYTTAAVFIFVVLGIVCRLAGFRLWALLKFIKEEILVAFGTSSSEAVLPQLMKKLPHFDCCNKEIVGLVLPTGYSFNLDGTAIYLSAAAIFIAQAYGIDLTWTQQLSLIAILMISSKGAAGVTGSGFVTLAATLSATNVLPVEGLVLLIGIDRFMSEIRTITNAIGNSVATVVVSRWDAYYRNKA